MIEQELAAFKQRLIGSETTRKSEGSVNDMLKFLVFGHATFLTQELKLGEFAASDHAGSSIRMVLDRIKSAQYTNNVNVKSPSGDPRNIVEGGPWDLKHTLEKAINKLNIDKWGVEYTDTEPRRGHQPRNDEA